MTRLACPACQNALHLPSVLYSYIYIIHVIKVYSQVEFLIPLGIRTGLFVRGVTRRANSSNHLHCSWVCMCSHIHTYTSTCICVHTCTSTFACTYTCTVHTHVTIYETYQSNRTIEIHGSLQRENVCTILLSCTILHTHVYN